MSIEQTERFWIWAEQLLDKRGLTWSEVERLAGLSNAAISRRARQLLPPTDVTCNGIAEAFNVPPLQVFRIAGILPAHIVGSGEDNDKKNELLDYYSSLLPDNRATLIAIAQTLHERQADY